MSYEFFTTTFPWVLPMGQFFLAIFLLLFFAVTVNALENRQWQKQKTALADWKFAETYNREVLLKHPSLNENDIAEAFEVLRKYFYVCWKDDATSIAIPSQLVDDCWHAFACDTDRYMQFCESVFGYYLQRLEGCK